MYLVDPDGEKEPSLPPQCWMNPFLPECQITCTTGYTILCLEEEYQEVFLRAYKLQDLRLCKYALILSEYDNSLLDLQSYADNVYIYIYIYSIVYSMRIVLLVLLLFNTGII